MEGGREGGRECGRRKEKRKRTLVFKRFTIQCYSRDWRLWKRPMQDRWFHVSANEFKTVGLFLVDYRLEQFKLGHMFIIINAKAPKYSHTNDTPREPATWHVLFQEWRVLSKLPSFIIMPLEQSAYRNKTILCIIMLTYFSRVLFILAHCLTDNIYLPVFKNIYSLIIIVFIYWCVFFLN